MTILELFNRQVPSRAFRARLRKSLDEGTLLAELDRTVHELVHPESVWLWCRGGQDMPTAGKPSLTPQDPLVAYVLAHAAPTPVRTISFSSPMLDYLQESGAHLLVPLVSLGQLVDLLVLKAPNTPSFSRSVLGALEEIAALTAAALRIIQLTNDSSSASLSWTSNTEEMRIAQAIQRSLLPESLPAPPGWQIGAHYQPAQVVGGDLYDVIPLPNDLLGIVLGDVSDKSVPAALMMAATRTLLHATAQRVVLPDQVLARVNDALCTQIPPGVFVTCFFAILDPGTGRLRFANAGQCAPVHCAQAGPTELRARGWPLGMMPGASYDEAEIVIAPGESILCFSDGLIESHDAEGAMFGASSVLSAIASAPHDSIPLIETILSEHNRFVGPIWRQEDDLTLFSITRFPPTPNDSNFREGAPKSLGDFQVPSQEGTERLAAERVVDLTREVDLTNQQRERLKTAVAETVMNAIEHGNLHRPDLMVGVSVLYDDMKLIVRVSDHGRNSAIPIPVMPDLEAKLSGHQSPRGWGLFLIENMVDEMRVLADGAGHTVELVIHLAQPNDHTATVTAP